MTRPIKRLALVLALIASATAFAKDPEPGITDPNGHTGNVYAVAFSPDGKTLASSGEDGVIRLRDPRTGVIQTTLAGHQKAVGALAFSPDSKTLASGGIDQTVRLWDVATGKSLATLEGHTGDVYALAFTSDGKMLASSGADTSIRIWDASAKTLIRSLVGHLHAVRGLAFSPDGKTLASAGGKDNTFRFWNVADGTVKVFPPQQPIPGQPQQQPDLGPDRSPSSSAARCVAFSPNGDIVACAGGQSITFRDANTNAPMIATNVSGEILAIAFSPDKQTLAVAHLEQIPPAPPGVAASSAIDRNEILLLNTANLSTIATLGGHSGTIWSVAYSPDGKTLASAGADRTVWLWDTMRRWPTARLTGPFPEGSVPSSRLMKHSEPVVAEAISPDGKTVAAAGDGAIITLWDTASHEPRSLLEVPAPPGALTAAKVRALAYSPDGKFLVSGGDDRLVTFWDAASGQAVFTLPSHDHSVTCLAFSRDGKTLVSGSQDASAIVWDLAGKKPKFTLARHTSAVDCVAISPDGKTFATGGHDWTIKLWDAETGAIRDTLEGHRDKISALAYAKDGKTLASSSHDGTVRIWDTASLSSRVITSEMGPLFSVVFLDDGESLITAGQGDLMRWRAGVAKGAFQGAFHTRIGTQILSLALSADGKMLASGGTGRELILWDVAKDLAPRKFAGHGAKVSATTVSTDGTTMATGDANGRIKVWDLATQLEKASFEGHSGAIDSLSLSADGSRLTSTSAGSGQREAKLWDVTTKQLVSTQPRAGSGAIPFSPDGKTIAMASRGSELLLLQTDAQASKTLTANKGTGAIASSAFSPDGKLVAGGSDDGTVTFWNRDTKAVLVSKKEHRKAVTLMAFSPDGKTLASGGADRAIVLWDVATRSKRAVLRGPKKAIASLAFSPDGKTLANVSFGDASIYVWDVASAQLRSTLSASEAGCVAFLPDGRLLTGSSNGVDLWDLAVETSAFHKAEPLVAQPRANLRGHFAPLRSLDVSRDGKTLASRDEDCIIKVWSVENGLELATIGAPDAPSRSMALAPDGRSMATGVRTIPVPSPKANAPLVEPLQDIPATLPPPPDVPVAPPEPPADAPRDAVKAPLGTPPDVDQPAVPQPSQAPPEPKPEAKVWDIDGAKLKATLSGVDGDAVSLEYSPDGKTLATASRKGVVALWDAQTFAPLPSPTGHEGTVDLVGFTPDGKTLAAASASGRVTLWDAGATKPRATFSHDGGIAALRAFPDGKTFATGGGANEPGVDEYLREGGQVCLWDAASGKRMRVLAVSEGRVTRLAISPDGARIAAATDSKNVVVWDVASGKRLAVLAGHASPVLSLAFSPDGSFLATGDEGDIRLWDASTAHIRNRWKGHEDAISWITFTPDGKTLATASRDASVKLWDVPAKSAAPK